MYTKNIGQQFATIISGLQHASLNGLAFQSFINIIKRKRFHKGSTTTTTTTTVSTKDGIQNFVSLIIVIFRSISTDYHSVKIFFTKNTF